MLGYADAGAMMSWSHPAPGPMPGPLNLSDLPAKIRRVHLEKAGEGDNDVLALLPDRSRAVRWVHFCPHRPFACTLGAHDATSRGLLSFPDLTSWPNKCLGPALTAREAAIQATQVASRRKELPIYGLGSWT